ncbi:MAG: DUF4198 domain-containing protein [Deltaproteobacteria bacterium]|jgi:uncharacterized GH25 family protein|nr:DUF4198 domain-containing protein [Deltaproteobacteria bacterium]
MKKLAVLIALAVCLLAYSPASAHDMWATAVGAAPGQGLTANIGYGHHFPAMEDIPAAELPFFQIWAVGPDGKIDLTQGSPNYVFTSEAKLAKGTYLVVSDVKPIYWTRTTTGRWEMKPKNEVPGAVSCENAIENAKGIIAVDGDAAGALATAAQGLPLEIVPLVHPATVKAGQALPIQVLFEGKPLAGAEVKARYNGFPGIASDTAMAFTDTTDQEGKVNFVPLAAGEWIVLVRNDTPYSGPDTCDKNSYGHNLHLVIN